MLTSTPMTGFVKTYSFGAPSSTPTIVSSFANSGELPVSTNGRGNPVVHGMRVFRTGTFTDMFGEESTWTDDQLKTAVYNFGLLREQKILPDVPVKADHSISVKNLVGWFSNLYLDLKDPQYLAADVEFTEPDAFDKWQRGTYRNRSVEIGLYKSNNGAMYFPVVRGLAFVDLPAVEGLHHKEGDEKLSFFHLMTDNKEDSLVDPNDPNWATAAQYAQALQDWEKAANYAAALDSWGVAASYAQACVDWERAVLYAASQEQGAGQHSAHQSAPFMFRIGDRQTASPTEVQGFIDSLGVEVTALRAFQDETQTSARASFVDKLASDGKIAAPQIDQLKAFAQGLSPQQFDSFRASYEQAPSVSLFGNHGQQGTPPPGPGSSDPADDKAVLVETVSNFRTSGMDEDATKKTKAFAKLSAIDPDAAAQAAAAL